MENSNSFRGSLRNLSGQRQFNNSNNSGIPVRDYNITEEELYERRRQQELRRQIQAKEQELEQLSNNKERLGQRFGIHTWNQPQKVEETGSKTRYDKTPPQRFGGSPLRKISGSRSPKRPQQQQHSSSPLRQRSGSPARAYMPHPISNSQNEYLIQLQNDNNSLQRRLNLVLQELDRVNRDRSNLAQKFKIAEKDVFQMKRMLQEEDLDDKINRDLQMELNGMRDKNKEAKLKIADIDQRRSDAIGRLRVLQGERDRFMLNNEELSKDFQRKMGMVKAIEQELFHAHDRIQKILEEIERLKRQDASDSAHCHDVQMVLDRLRAERDDLMRKMQHLNRTYDNCVVEITRERQQMDLHNKHHSKLLVAKSLYQGLEVMQLARKQDALNEFFTYCRFDKKCHSTLKTFVDVLERLGRYKMKIAIKQWHQKAFKPIEVIDQQEELVGALANQKLLARTFNRWRLGYNLAQNLYGHKNKAVLAIWNAKVKDVKKDVQRAFTIWREKNNFEKLRKRKLKFLVWKIYNNRLTSAFNAWQRNMQEADGQVRLHVLARSFAENQLKLISFTQFKIQTHEKRRKRLNMLRAYLKAWKASNAYRGYMKVQMVNVLRFRHESNVSLMKRIFAALRQDWEETKHQLMTSALENEVLPQIEVLKQENAQNVSQETETAKKRCIEMMQKMIRTWLGSYFYKWRDMQERKQFGVNVHLKDLVIRAYKLRVQSAFNTWKKGKAHKEITQQQTTIMELQEQGVEMQSVSDQLGKEIQMQQADVDRSSRSALTRAVKICYRRFLIAGIRTWKESVDHKTSKEATVDGVVIQKIRLRFLRQAFDRYRDRTRQLAQMERNEQRADAMISQKMNKRLMRKVWNAMNAYKNTFADAKAHQGILVAKIELWMQRRAFHTWVAQGSLKAKELLIQETNQETQSLNQLMQASKELEIQKQQKTQSSNQLKDQYKKQSDRVIGNAFARYYHIGIARGFERWKEWLEFQKAKERAAQNLLKRFRSYNASFLLNALIQWREKAKIKDMNEASEELSQQIGKINQDIESYVDDSGQQAQILQENIAAEENEAAIAGARFQMVVGKFIADNDGNHFQSKLRACFLAWRDHTRRTIAFVKTLTHVIENTLWHQGFQNIKEFSRDKQLTRKQNNQLQRIKRMFWQRNCAAAFSKWKETEFQVACLAIESCQEETIRNQEVYDRNVDRFKDHNGDKYGRYMGTTKKHKIWQQWKAVTKMLKAQKNAKKVTLESFGGYLQIRALRKWIERVRATQFARDRVAKFHMLKHQIYQRAVFREWRHYFKSTKGLCLRLANMAAKFDNAGKQSAFQMIQNFKLAKDGTYCLRKKVAFASLSSSLKKIHTRKMTEYLSHLRTRCYNFKSVDMRKTTVIRHLMSRELRRAFNNWRKKTECVLTVEDVNECGPVVEEVLEARLMIKNCLDFLKKEGYTEKQIGQFDELAEQRNLDKLRKAVGHWRAHVNREPDDTQLLPICINRWKQFTQMRKIINHWLNFITEKKEPLKANLKQFFNRWKYHFNAKDAHLNRQNREYLLNRAIQSQQELNNLTEQEVQNEDLVTHLTHQNDELYDNYIKSNRLAFALSRDNLEHAKRKAFSRMLDNSNKTNAGKFGESLGNNIDRISALKSKIAEIEKDNEMLANENEDLRQFTLDGYQIAKSCQSLDQEREKLSVDLADKAAMIKKLLDENERLSSKLRSVQEQVVRAADEMQHFSRSNRYMDNNSARQAYRQF